MSRILIVDDDVAQSRRAWPRYIAGQRKNAAPTFDVTPWSSFDNRIREQAAGDVVILNLEASGAPAFQEAMRLTEKQPNLRYLYVVDVKRKMQSRSVDELCRPGVAWVSSDASEKEVQLRIRGLVSSQAQDAPVPPWERTMPELHNLGSGRLDASRVAEWFGIPLKTVARLLRRGYATVHKTPDAMGLQSELIVFFRIASALERLAGSYKAARIWLNSPNPDLDNNATPLSVIEMGDQDVVAELLEDAIVGQPG
jgi:hypothetical protein